MPIILATQEAEIRRMVVQSQSRQIIPKTLSRKSITKRAGGVAQGEGPEFKPQYWKKKKIFLKDTLTIPNCKFLRRGHNPSPHTFPPPAQHRRNPEVLV
jgi:hypothetical protein